MSELVSIVVANYNKEKYISQAIESIILQDYKNLEIVIIDDGSTDESVNIIKNYAENDNRILYKCLKHEGKILAYNYGVSITTGEYVKIASSDDVLFNNAISSLIEGVGSYEVVCHNTIITDEKLNVINKAINMNKYRKISLDKILNGLSFPSGCYFFRKSVTQKLYPIPLNASFEDWYMFLYLIYNNFKIDFVDESLSYYRQVKNSSYGGFYNVNKDIFIYRAKREIDMINVFKDILPNSYDKKLNNIEKELKLISQGSILKSLIYSKHRINKRAIKIVIKMVYYPLIMLIVSLKKKLTLPR